MYAEGQGVDQDWEQAREWWQKAADQGHSDAQQNLGRMYAKGEGVGQDFQKAVAWYQKAADKGLYAAQYDLGLLYFQGKGIPQNFLEAFKWCSLSLAKNFDKGKSKILIVLQEKMTPQDVARAQKQAQTLWHEQNH